MQKLHGPKLPKYKPQLLEKNPEPKTDSLVRTSAAELKAIAALRQELIVRPELEIVQVGLEATKVECHDLIKEQSEYGFRGKKFAVASMTLVGIGTIAMCATITALICSNAALANVFAWLGLLTLPTGVLGMVGPKIVGEDLGERARKWLNSIDPLQRRMDRIGRELPLLIETHSELVKDAAKEPKRD